MPKTIINYQNTIIYKLVCNDLNVDNVYVGHTTNFINRKRSHKERCTAPNSKKYHYKVYKMIRENEGWNNWSMIEIEKYPCNDKNEACARERYWYELLNANMNSRCPTLNVENRKEKSKISRKRNYEANREAILQKAHEYAASHKEQIKENKKIYRKNNIEKIKARKSMVCICEICNKEYTHNHKSRHEKTKFHLKVLDEIKNGVVMQ